MRCCFARERATFLNFDDRHGTLVHSTKRNIESGLCIFLKKVPKKAFFLHDPSYPSYADRKLKGLHVFSEKNGQKPHFHPSPPFTCFTILHKIIFSELSCGRLKLGSGQDASWRERSCLHGNTTFVKELYHCCIGRNERDAGGNGDIVQEQVTEMALYS